MPDPSLELQAFVAEAPAARRPHLDLLGEAAAFLAPGSRVLDVGAGDAPYRELFAAHDYRTVDWEGTIYAPEQGPDYVGLADDLPIENASFDAVLCTQVLEHVPEPAAVLRELYRVLRPGGWLWLTTPLTWYLHELPHDYYRYTPAGLAYLATAAGFADHEIKPMNSTPETIGQLLRHLEYLLGTPGDGYDQLRGQAGRVARDLAVVVESFSDLDSQWHLPISFYLRTCKPAAG